MASPSELTLDYNPNTNTTSYPLIQKSTFGDQLESTSQINLEDFLARLEEERHKIEAFKRELPLCMQLLNNAMETYRRQLETYQNNSNLGPRPVLEEFIPLSNMSINCNEKLATPTSEKANWMVSAQLWSPATATEPTNTKLALDTKHRNGSGGGAFLPFSKEKNGSNKGFGPGLRALPELALAASAEKEEVEEKKCEVGGNGGVIVSKGVVGGVSESKGGNNGNEGQAAAGGQSTHRKARRCWSPDLHRRFVNALHMLGGSQAATPKQIRELMKVDGLTNDEVKSHLQKYRLHTRRPIQPPQPPATAAPQLVVLGGIWVPPEYASAAAAAAAAGAPTIYPAAPTAAHYPIAHHEFYAAAPLPPGTHHYLHRTATMADPCGRAQASAHSPESELRSSRDPSESINDDDEGEEREVEEDDDDEQEDEMEEVKAEDNALVPVEGSGNAGVVALEF